jgi:cytochrome c-type biogenesis protein CcmH
LKRLDFTSEDFTMTLWLILTIMTSVAAVWLVVPLLRRSDRPLDETAGDIAVYEDQLQEVGRELRDGRIDAAEAETARTEIKRRILAAGQQLPAAVPGLSGRERSFVIVSATAIVAVGSAILYAVIGSPDLASTPRASRAAVEPGESGALPAWHPALENAAAADRTSDGDGGEPPTGLPTVEEMTGRLAARLARNPGDIGGWRTLGWSYLNLGRFDEAANTYAKAIERDPGNAELRGGRIEALIGAANGVVTPDARRAIGDLLRLDPKDARARYFAGLANEQEGDKAAALATWTELLNDAGANGQIDGSLASDLKSRVADLKRDMGIDGGAPAAGVRPAIVAATSRPSRAQDGDGAGAPRAAEKGPRPQDVQAADAMPPTDRAAMIRGMVDGLASRLERSPQDADGWIRLIRSRVVLGEGNLAKQALARGLAAFAADAPERSRIAAAAHELGVGQ